MQGVGPPQIIPNPKPLSDEGLRLRDQVDEGYVGIRGPCMGVMSDIQILNLKSQMHKACLNQEANRD